MKKILACVLYVILITTLSGCQWHYLGYRAYQISKDYMSTEEKVYEEDGSCSKTL